MHKKILLLVIPILLAAILAWFSTNRKTDRVIVLLDWLPNTNHTGLFVAKENNYFNNNGLEVAILQPAETDNLAIVGSRRADFAVSSQEAVTLARAKGIPVVSIAAIIQHNTSAFASLESSGIKNISDFEGKRYGGWGSPIEEAMLKGLMTKRGADYSKVKNITLGISDFFKTIGKDSDFQWIFFGWDGIEAKRRNIPLNIIMLRDLDPVFDYYTPVIVTSEENIIKNEKMVKKFMTAVRQGYEYSAEKPSEAGKILLLSAPEINPELVTESQKYISSQYVSDSEVWGLQKKEVWDRYTNWLYENKLIEVKIESDQAFTNRFLQ